MGQRHGRGFLDHLSSSDPQLNVNDGARCTGDFLNLCPQITGATELNESVLNYGGTAAAYFAVPQPDPGGNVNTVFTFSSATEYASLTYISQRATQANDTFVRLRVYPPGGIGPRIYPAPLGWLRTPSRPPDFPTKQAMAGLFQRPASASPACMLSATSGIPKSATTSSPDQASLKRSPRNIWAWELLTPARYRAGV